MEGETARNEVSLTDLKKTTTGLQLPHALCEYSAATSQGSSLGLKHCIIRHLLFVHAFSKYLVSPFLGPGTFLGARGRKCLPLWVFIPVRVERDNTLRKNDTGRTRSAGEFAILIVIRAGFAE